MTETSFSLFELAKIARYDADDEARWMISTYQRDLHDDALTKMHGLISVFLTTARDAILHWARESEPLTNPSHPTDTDPKDCVLYIYDFNVYTQRALITKLGSQFSHDPRVWNYIMKTLLSEGDAQHDSSRKELNELLSKLEHQLTGKYQVGCQSFAGFGTPTITIMCIKISVG